MEIQDKTKTLCINCKHRFMALEKLEGVRTDVCLKSHQPLYIWAKICNGYEEGFIPTKTLLLDGKIEIAKS